MMRQALNHYHMKKYLCDLNNIIFPALDMFQNFMLESGCHGWLGTRKAKFLVVHVNEPHINLLG